MSVRHPSAIRPKAHITRGEILFSSAKNTKATVGGSISGFDRFFSSQLNVDTFVRGWPLLRYGVRGTRLRDARVE